MSKILCIIDGLGSGGAQRQLVGLASLLRQEKYEVSLLWYHKNSFFRSFLEQNNVKCIHVSPTNWITKVMAIHKAISYEQPNVVISYLGGPCIISCIHKLVTKTKYKLIVSERNTTLNQTFRERVRFALYRVADAIVPNSFSQMRFLQKKYPHLSDKVYTITNFVDTDKYCPSSSWERGETFRILIVGRISQQKNVLRFLKVVSEIKKMGLNIHFDWYGAAHDMSYYERVQKLYEDLGITDVVTFHKPDLEIAKQYQLVDAFCLPSLYEGFPNVICEAMSCGLPILGSNVCDNPNIIEDNQNGYLFDPCDINDMVNKIVKLYNTDEVTIMNFRDRSRKIALKKFRIDTFVRQYIELINKLK